MPVLLLLVSVLLVACTATAESEVRADDADVDEVQERLREVAVTRSEVDGRLEAALGVVGEVDAVIETSRTPALAADGLAALQAVRDDLEDLDPEELREELRELATSIDEARASLATALEDREGWQADYLVAQDQVLGAVREHAAACDALVQLIDRHRPAYEAALDRLAEVEEEWAEAREDDDAVGAPRQRDLAEEVEAALSGRLEAVALAQEELATYAERREATAEAVNQATADAATVFDRRSER
jgi:hypothetical protein